MKLKTETRVCIKMNRDYFTEVAGLAQKSGIRARGVLLYSKIHGFDVPNTKSLSKFFRFCVAYYKENEPRRLREQADLLAEEKAIIERKRKLGMHGG